MVEQNTVASEHVVRLACEYAGQPKSWVWPDLAQLTVVLDDPESVKLGDAVR